MDISSTLNVAAIIETSIFSVYSRGFSFVIETLTFDVSPKTFFQYQRLILVRIVLAQLHQRLLFLWGCFLVIETSNSEDSSVITSKTYCTFNESGFDTDFKFFSIRFSLLYFLCFLALILLRFLLYSVIFVFLEPLSILALPYLLKYGATFLEEKWVVLGQTLSLP